MVRNSEIIIQNAKVFFSAAFFDVQGKAKRINCILYTHVFEQSTYVRFQGIE